MWFISGVNGVGKSALIPHLKEFLPSEEYVVRDFDERGVPDNANQAWRLNEIRYWIEEGESLAREGAQLVICGFVKPKDLASIILPADLQIQFILLDATSEVIRERLHKRYASDGDASDDQKVIGKPLKEFIESSVWTLTEMRSSSEAADYAIIDTSEALPRVIARKAAEIIQLTPHFTKP